MTSNSTTAACVDGLSHACLYFSNTATERALSPPTPETPPTHMRRKRRTRDTLQHIKSSVFDQSDKKLMTAKGLKRNYGLFA